MALCDEECVAHYGYTVTAPFLRSVCNSAVELLDMDST